MYYSRNLLGTTCSCSPPPILFSINFSQTFVIVNAIYSKRKLKTKTKAKTKAGEPARGARRAPT